MSDVSSESSNSLLSEISDDSSIWDALSESDGDSGVSEVSTDSNVLFDGVYPFRPSTLSMISGSLGIAPSESAADTLAKVVDERMDVHVNVVALRLGVNLQSCDEMLEVAQDAFQHLRKKKYREKIDMGPGMNLDSDGPPRGQCDLALREWSQSGKQQLLRGPLNQLFAVAMQVQVPVERFAGACIKRELEDEDVDAELVLRMSFGAVFLYQAAWIISRIVRRIRDEDFLLEFLDENEELQLTLLNHDNGLNALIGRHAQEQDFGQNIIFFRCDREEVQEMTALLDRLAAQQTPIDIIHVIGYARAELRQCLLSNADQFC